jgi:hypothetical protein
MSGILLPLPAVGTVAAAVVIAALFAGIQGIGAILLLRVDGMVQKLVALFDRA